MWLGVLGAVMLAGSFAAVLTYSASELSSRAQEAAGGLLSVLAVGLVTGMVFWMRRTAAGLSAQLRGEVQRAVAIGAGALTVTAFLAVGREGLETTLFLWAAVRASGSTVAPLVGAGLGLAAAVALCWLLYRRAVRLNVGVFFNRTAVALIVIAAGVLSYGLGDLQAAGVLPGQHWVAFDLTAHVDPGSWWVSLLTGVTELSPEMTVLQAVAWVTYLAVVIPAFIRAGRSAAVPRPTPAERLAPGSVRGSVPGSVSGSVSGGPGPLGADGRAADLDGSRGAGRGAGGGGRHRDRGAPGGESENRHRGDRHPGRVRRRLEFRRGRNPDVHRGQRVRKGRRDQPGQRGRRGGGRDRDARPGDDGGHERDAGQRLLRVRVLPVRAGRDELGTGAGYRTGQPGRNGALSRR